MRKKYFGPNSLGERKRSPRPPSCNGGGERKEKRIEGERGRGREHGEKERKGGLIIFSKLSLYREMLEVLENEILHWYLVH